MKSIFKKYAKLLLISGSALIFSGSAFAAKTHLTMGMSLEPPHLDPQRELQPQLTKRFMPMFLKV